ncbi:MAG: hypothetical protein ACYS32_05145 [Planctomycetota bacterium]
MLRGSWISIHWTSHKKLDLNQIIADGTEFFYVVERGLLKPATTLKLLRSGLLKVIYPHWTIFYLAGIFINVGYKRNNNFTKRVENFVAKRYRIAYIALCVFFSAIRITQYEI